MDSITKIKECPIFGCCDNKITQGQELGPQLYFVSCASPEHVFKVYGWTQEEADNRWNKIKRIN